MLSDFLFLLDMEFSFFVVFLQDSLLSILSMVLVPSPSVPSNDISHSVLSGAAYGKAMVAYY